MAESNAHPAPHPLREPGTATVEDFERLDLRVARIVAAEPFPEARRPAYRLTLDLGAGRSRRSSARLSETYPDPAGFVGRLVIVVANLPPDISPASAPRCWSWVPFRQTAGSLSWGSIRVPSRAIAWAEEPSSRACGGTQQAGAGRGIIRRPGRDLGRTRILQGSIAESRCEAPTSVLRFPSLRRRDAGGE